MNNAFYDDISEINDRFEQIFGDFFFATSLRRRHRLWLRLGGTSRNDFLLFIQTDHGGSKLPIEEQTLVKSAYVQLISEMSMVFLCLPNSNGEWSQPHRCENPNCSPQKTAGNEGICDLKRRDCLSVSGHVISTYVKNLHPMFHVRSIYQHLPKT